MSPSNTTRLLVVLAASLIVASARAHAQTVALLTSDIDFAGRPSAVVTDAAGSVFVADPVADTVQRVSPTGVVDLVLDATGDGQGNVLAGPVGLVVDDVGDLFVAGGASANVFRVTPSFQVSLVLDGDDAGPGLEFSVIEDMHVDATGALLVGTGPTTSTGGLVLRKAPGAPVQVLHAASDPAFHVLDVEGDPVGGAFAVARSLASGAPLFLEISATGAVSTCSGPSSFAPWWSDAAIDAAGKVWLVTSYATIPADLGLYSLSSSGCPLLSSGPHNGSVGILDDGATGKVMIAQTFNVFLGLESALLFGSTPVIDAAGVDGVPLFSPGPVHGDDRGRMIVVQDEPDAIFVYDRHGWTDLGGGSPGANGTPRLSVSGPLAPGTPMERHLVNAPPGALTLAWLSFTSAPFPALGGVLHAFPWSFQWFFVADALGTSSLTVTWPSGIPAGQPLYLQFLVQDASVPDGITLSNAVTAVTN